MACGDTLGWGEAAKSGVALHGHFMIDEAAAEAFAVLEGGRGLGPEGAVFGRAVENSSLPLL